MRDKIGQAVAYVKMNSDDGRMTNIQLSFLSEETSELNSDTGTYSDNVLNAAKSQKSLTEEYTVWMPYFNKDSIGMTLRNYQVWGHFA